MSDEIRCHFGKHKDVLLAEIPSGYLRWACENIDPVPLPKYRFHEDGTAMTLEEVKQMEDDMRNFLSAAADELNQRDES
jgi:hypothetical protein